MLNLSQLGYLHCLLALIRNEATTCEPDQRPVVGMEVEMRWAGEGCASSKSEAAAANVVGEMLAPP